MTVAALRNCSRAVTGTQGTGGRENPRREFASQPEWDRLGDGGKLPRVLLMIPVFPLFAMAMLMLAGCVRVTGGDAARPAVVEKWSGMNADVDTAGERVVRSEAEWRTLWQQIGRDVPRPLDTSQEMAVAVFSGQKRTGGYSVEITRVREQSGQWIVEAVATSPGEGMMTTQALTSPWAVAVLPRTSADVKVRVHMGSAGEAASGRAGNPASPSARE